jgi:UDP-N-acetylglucosamine/UDP-N-acetylgalactosamine diphosphorylase
MAAESEIRSRYEAAGQGHVLKHFAELNQEDKDSLLKQLDAIKVEGIASLLESALKDQQNVLGVEIQPFSNTVGRSADMEETTASTAIGIEAISRGQVAAVVLAGGQGTRLGFEGPKGMYDIGLPSGRTLFQLMSERIDRLRHLAANTVSDDDASSLPFYIMTSPINHDPTVAFFEDNQYFRLPSADVCFFPQGMLPCLTEDGKIIMETASSVAMAPDGNGGIYPSLQQSGMLDDMTRRGVKYLHVFSIDNALTKPADPNFVGYCISEQADCGNKVVWKANAHEKVGVIAEKAGKPCVVEYSDITTEMAEATDDDGRLVFGAGNICNHFYTLDFLRDVVVPRLGKMYHVARKKIAYYDEGTKSTVAPTCNNGIKLESFIFDVFPLSQKMAVLDVQRTEEFAPVKNARGSPSDSPDTARELISKLAQKWVVDAGGTLAGNLESACEVAPLTSYCGEGLETLAKKKEIECPFSL